MTTLFRRILVPYDFSPHAARALGVAAGLAAERKGRVTVLHVMIPYPVTGLIPAEGLPFIPPDNLIPPARKRLETEVRRVLGRRRVKFTCRVELGDPAQTIIEDARRADTIVMSTAGRTGLGHLLIGSVAEKVVRHAPCPVLTLRAGVRRAAIGRRRRTRRRRAARRRR